ncbi:MAG TPA: helix-turn-helix domain-containing protein [Abditibacterium sp.]|jgi:excisionase family DNA binding protein
MNTLFMKVASPVPTATPQSRSISPAAEVSDARLPTSKAPAPKISARRTASSTAEDEENASDCKKRVRLKPESREQLLERLRNPQLSLHEASILLRVSRATVRRYADSGRLTCQRTPGGQRRFFLRDIETFYRQLKMKK